MSLGITVSQDLVQYVERPAFGAPTPSRRNLPYIWKVVYILKYYNIINIDWRRNTKLMYVERKVYLIYIENEEIYAIINKVSATVPFRQKGGEER